MFRLAGILFSMISTSLMGTLFVIALVLGRDGYADLIAAAGIGFVLAIPLSYAITKAISQA